MRGAIRYYLGQSLSLLVLSALLTATAVFAPLYARAVEQGLVRAGYDQLPASRAGLVFTSVNPLFPDHVVDSAALGTYLPVELQPVIASQTRQVSVAGTLALPGAPDNAARLLWRQDLCAHITLLQGRCPTARNEVAVAATDPSTVPPALGSSAAFTEDPPSGQGQPPRKQLRVTGYYRIKPGFYWSRAVSVETPTESAQLGLTLLTAEATMAGSPARLHNGRAPNPADTAPGTAWVNRRNELDVALRPHAISVDTLPGVTALVAQAMQNTRANPDLTITADSGLPDLAAGLAGQGHEGQVTIAVLARQLGLVTVLVLWFVLSAAVASRRSDVAIALLRGYPAGGAYRFLLGQLSPPVLAGAPLGVGLAWLAMLGVRRLVLVPGIPLELVSAAGVGFLLALAAGQVACLLAVRRVPRAPIVDLLRRVPPRRGSVALGAGAALIVGAAATVLAGVLSGALTGPVVLLTPTVLALGAGALLSVAGARVAGGAGGALMRAGRAVPAAAALHVARSRTARYALPAVSVALALISFSTAALVVSTRNQQWRAEREVGAAAVQTLDTADAASTRQVVRSIDPDGTAATTVLHLTPVNPAATSMYAVVPAEFQRIALTPGQPAGAMHWAALRSTRPAPIQLTGAAVSVPVTLTKAIYEAANATDSTVPRRRVRVSLLLQQVPGAVNRSVNLGSLPPPRQRGVLRAQLGCQPGCILRGFTLSTGVNGPSALGLAIGPVSIDGRPVPLGGTADWGNLASADGPSDTVRYTVTNRAINLAAQDITATTLTVQQRAVPLRVPVLSGPGAVRDTGYAVDGTPVPAAGTPVPFIPGSSGPTQLADLDTIERLGSTGPASGITQVWYARDDTGLQRRVTAALVRRGIHVLSTDSTAGRRAQLSRSSPAWSLQLATLVAAATVALAALTLVTITLTDRARRAGQLRQLHLQGVAVPALRRQLLLEHLILLAPSAATGLTAGALGASLALPKLTLFAQDNPDYTPDTALPTLPVLTVALAATLLLGGLAAALVDALLRSAGLSAVAPKTSRTVHGHPSAERTGDAQASATT